MGCEHSQVADELSSTYDGRTSRYTYEKSVDYACVSADGLLRGAQALLANVSSRLCFLSLSAGFSSWYGSFLISITYTMANILRLVSARLF